MAKFVLLRIENDQEAQRLIEDMTAYPNNPLLTPSQENQCHATIMRHGTADQVALLSTAPEPPVGWSGVDSDGAIWQHRDSGWHFDHCPVECGPNLYGWGLDGGIAYPIREVAV